MTVAALVAGNAVILKPAEQSPAHRAVPGRNPPARRACRSACSSSSPAAARSSARPSWIIPDVDLISFTGSRAVGLEINRRAAETKPGQDHVKRVIAEMGGKNAAIIDDDADLDEAVVGIVQSAFGYAGQKCSACSRAIVLEAIYDAFVARLAEADQGPPRRPGRRPRHERRPRDRRRGAETDRRVSDASPRPRGVWSRRSTSATSRIEGHYVGPMVVADVAPTARIAQEEIFGPILAVLKAARPGRRTGDRQRDRICPDRRPLFAAARRTSPG